MKNRNKKVTAMLMAVVLSNCGITGGLSNVVFAESIDNGAEAAEQNAEETSEDMYENGSGRNITSDEETDSRFSYKSEENMPSLLTSSMSISQRGIDLIKSFEGFRGKAYKALSTEKYYTIGYGHYGADVYEGMTITKEEAERLLRSDLVKYTGYVNTFLNTYNITVNQNQFDALTSFTYNVGNVWKNQDFSLKRYLINGINNYSADQITTAFRNWNKSGGKVIPGLTRRREAEAKLFLEGVGQVTCNCSDSYAGDYVCTASSSLTIRSGHGTGYSKVGSIPHGATVYVSKGNGAWAHVSYNGMNGYASMDYLQKQNQVKAPSGYNISLSATSVYNSERPVLTISALSGETITNYKVYVKLSDGRVIEKDWGGTNSQAVLTQNLVGVTEFWAKVSNESGSYEGRAGDGSLKLQVQKADFGSTQNLGNDFYAVIRNEGGTVVDYAVSKNSNVEGWSSNGGKNQIWRFLRQADGSYKIVSKYDEGKALDVNDASNYSGSNVQAYRDNNSDAQRWFIYSAGNGYYYLRPKCSDSAVLDLYNRETSNGTNIQIWTTNQTGAQKWKLEKVRTEFTIQYNANGGSGTPESQKKQAEKALTLSKSIPTRTGYEFRGWSTSLGNQNVASLPGGNYTTDADKTLYAVWNPANTMTSSQKVNVDIAGAGRMYKITPQTTGTYCIESTGSLDTKAVLYNSAGTVLATNDDGGNGSNFRLECQLNKGETYYIEAKLYSSQSTGTFEMKMNRKVSVTDMSGVVIGGHAKDALRVNWNKNKSASGYILEQYSNGTWNRIARIEGNATTTYRVEKLKSDTTYQFRIKGFTFDGSTAVYGNYQTVSGKTDAVSLNLDSLNGVKISGRADNALRVNWNKNADASGYIIEQYSNGSWNRIARIGNGSTTTYRIENLKAGTNYQFRIKAFGFKGAEAVYGKYVSISGKTNPASVSGLKIGGTAKDALRLNWNTVSGAEGYIIEKYEANTWKRIARLEGGKTATYRTEGLKAGTSYRFRMRAFGFDGSTAIYGEYKEITGKTDAAAPVAPTVTVGAMTGVKIGGRADNALRLNWDKNTGASGYIIEQNQNGTWIRIARIGENSTTTYRVEKLSAGRTYQFRIRGFGFQGSTPVYGNFTYVNGTTIPAKVSGLCIGGTAADAIRLNWNKNTNASGYIIEKFQNGEWIRVARIADKNTQTYRVEGLQSRNSYVFRIRTFGFDGGTPLYSDYQMIAGNTK